MKEEPFKRKIMADVVSIAGYARKLSPYGNAGFPDLLIVKNRTLHIEAKQAQNHAAMFKKISVSNPLQNIERKKIIHAGGNYWLAGSTKKHGVILICWLPYDVDRGNSFVFEKYAGFKEFLFRFLKGEKQ